MHTIAKSALAVFSIAAFGTPALAEDRVYGPFPITLKGYEGPAKNSVKYTGQIARQVLHDSLKALAGRSKGEMDAALKARMTAYFSGTDKDRAIIAPASKTGFPILQTQVDQISAGTDLAGKTYGGAISGWPNNLTGSEVVKFWIDKAAAAKGGFDPRNGYDYPQLISKFILGATFYNQAVDNYLDEKLDAGNKPNDMPYGEGDPYTGKEHSWDEAFGYFGAPAHALKLTAQQVHDIAKQKPEALAAADFNKDGKVDLLSEMTFGPAYYAAGFDAGTYGSKNQTRYLHTIVEAFLEGRKLIAEAKGAKLTDAQRAKLKEYAATIETAWQQVLAEAVFKYAGAVYADLRKLQTIVEAKGQTDKALRTYAKHWGELKGFSLALQTGRENLGETALRLNRLIGYGPLMPNQSQVTGVTSDGTYLKGQGPAFGEYMLHMLKVQRLMIDKFGIKGRINDQMANMKGLSDKVKIGGSAEND